MTKSKYKCDNCGAEGQYTLMMERFVEQIYDGPHRIVGYEDNGSIVTVHCDVCNEELTPTEEDFNRLYVPKKGVIFYK